MLGAFDLINQRPAVISGTRDYLRPAVARAGRGRPVSIVTNAETSPAFVFRDRMARAREKYDSESTTVVASNDYEGNEKSTRLKAEEKKNPDQLFGMFSFLFARARGGNRQILVPGISNVNI